MRSVAYLLVCLGVLLLITAAYSEHSGIAMAMAPTELSTIVSVAKQTENPEEFRNLMTYEWLESGLTVLAGVVILAFVRRADTLDPLSDRFSGSDAIDELERTLKQEEERRRGSLKP